MRLPPPPQPILSQDGRILVCKSGDQLYTIRIQDSSVTQAPSPQEGHLMVLSPYGTLGALAGYGQLTLFECDPTFAVLATTSTPANLFRMAVGEGATVVGTPTFDEKRSTLCVWRTEELYPAFSGDGTPLGEVAPFHIRLDEHRNRILIWGVSGPGAFSSGGEFFSRLYSFTDTGAQPRWAGETMPFQPRGFLFPLSKGKLGMHDREQLAIMSADIRFDHDNQPLNIHQFAGMETVVTSPGGTFIAWLWNDQSGQYHFCVAQLDEGIVTEEVLFDYLGRFATLAVDDTGRATLVFSEKPDRILAFVLEEGQLAQRVDLKMNR